MARYVTLLRFTDQGARALNKSVSRAQAFRKTAEKAGVKVEAQFWTVGSYDGIVILSSDQEKHILKVLGQLAAAGNVRTETLQALDDAEFSGLFPK